MLKEISDQISEKAMNWWRQDIFIYTSKFNGVRLRMHKTDQFHIIDLNLYFSAYMSWIAQKLFLSAVQATFFW